jgi:hypothetical protein
MVYLTKRQLDDRVMGLSVGSIERTVRSLGTIAQNIADGLITLNDHSVC